MIAAITLPELAPILTIFVGMLGGFYALVKFMLNQAEKAAEADRKERQQLATAIATMAENTNRMADKMELVATSNVRIADESEKRNGHLAEISVENKDQILKAIKGLTIDKQTVKHQTVEHEIVKNKE